MASPSITPAIADPGRAARSTSLKVPLATLAATLALLYLPVLLGQVMFFRDPANWNYPARFFLRQALRAGEHPTWNPLGGLGFPVLANPLYGLFYPPNWLYVLLPESAVVHMTTWQSLGHLFWGGIGVMVLLRLLAPATTVQAAAPHVAHAATFIAAAVFCLSGYITAQWTAGLLLLADAWVPWCGVGFVAATRILTTPGRGAFFRAVALAAAPVAAAFLFGEIFIAMMGAGFGLVTASAAAFAPESPRSPPPLRAPARRLLAAAALALGLGTLAGAVVIIPAAAAAAATDRGSKLDRATAEIASLHPLRFVEMIAPGAMGTPYEDFPGGRWLNEASLDGTPLSHSMYLGAGALVLAAIALGRGRRLAGALTLAVALGIVLALGRHTPVHNLWRSLVPPLGYMRFPEKYMVLVTTWLAVLAGLGAARLLSAGEGRRAVGAGLTLLLALAALAGLFPGELAPYVRHGALVGSAVVVCVGLACYLVARRPRAAAILLAIVVAGDLAAAAVPLQHFGPASIATRATEVVTAIKADHAAHAAPDSLLAPPRAHRTRAAELNVSRFVHVESYATGQARSMELLAENASHTFGIALLPGYDAAIPSAMSALWQEGAAGLQAGQTGPDVKDGKDPDFRGLRLFGVGYAVLPAPEGSEPPARLAALDPIADPITGARLYRVRKPLPRLYLAGQSVVVDNDVWGEGVRGLFADPVLAGHHVTLGNTPGATPLPGPPGRAGTCTLTRFATHEITATCAAAREAVAVLLEQYDPGWRVEVDGREAPLLRANRVFRAVHLAPGSHTLRFWYEARSLGIGLWLSAAALVLIALFACARVRAA